MKLPMAALAGLIAVVSPALAAPKELTLEAVNGADLKAKPGDGPSALMIKAQVLLDRARFSPGVIDGRPGENVEKAIAAFKAARKLKTNGALDEEVWAKLNEASSEPALIEYTIRDEDLKGPFTAKIPDKMEDQAELDRLGYSGPEEMLAERFHMDRDLLQALNAGKSFDKAGERILVANVAPDRSDQKPPKVTRIEVDKSERLLRALGEDGTVLAAYPASVGSEDKPAPDGTHTVTAVAKNPTYTYNPDYKFKGVKAKEKFEIKAGPNNPVGSVWIDLSVESYGIHGTPDPDKVGKAYSHGCIRLTNWDVEELAQMVEKGAKVTIAD
ncbi:MAG TPA: L,D-transpeptidase family protein [Microvirga sp.]|jgi:lipoprotein-anchoring transpeptidase ErfK/SrfK